MSAWILDKLYEKRNSKDLAIIHRDDSITYSELWSNSEKIASYIFNNKKNKSPVIIYGNKNNEIVEIMLGSLKSGVPYIPVDITFPVDRVKKIQEISNSKIIFNLSSNDIEINDDSVKIVNADELYNILNIDLESDLLQDNWVSDEDVCYILFTSGSTGMPKGVPISKKNIINFVEWFEDTASVKGNVALNQVSYSFDVSVIQLYIYLPNGVALYSIDKNMITDFGEMFEFLKKSNISSWVSTPSFLEMCMIYDSFDRNLLPELEKIILAGEVLTKKLVYSIKKKFPEVEVINGYGPTEGTVLLTACTITDDMLEDDKNELPIGYLLKDANYKIEKINLDEADNINSVNENKGELVVSSKSISKGYFNNEIETKTKFFFDEKHNCMEYKTGDIVYKINDLFYYCGRKDFQIKLNGYRIELDDICENINKIDIVSNNIVLPAFKDGKVQYIAAFVLLNKNVDIEESSLRTNVYIRKELGKLIPSYMIPKKVVIIDRFPLNVNGKIDRKLLREKYL